MNTPTVSEAELQAYVDGLLPQERCAAVEAYLAAHPEEAERVRAYREQRLALRALFDPVLEEPLPARLRGAAQPQAEEARDARLPRWSPGRIAAGIAALCVSAVLGWVARGEWQPAPPSASFPGGPGEASLPRQAAIAHVVFSPDVRRPVELGADQEEQLVAWVSKRLGAAVRAPKLGAELIGGRLLPGASGPVAQFMYHDVTGQRLTLYVSTEYPGAKDTAFRFAQEGPVNVFYWVDGPFAYALSAGIGKAELARLATAVYSQLQAR
jgi:anti-sigma factor RsiW